MLEWIGSILDKFWDYIKIAQVVDEFEMGVLLRWGRPVSVLEPGLHWKFPLSDYAYTANIKPDTMLISAVNLTTLDNKQLAIGGVIEYEIDNIVKYIIETNEPVSNMHHLAMGIISDEVEDINWEDIRKKATKTRVKKRLLEKCESMGINIIDFYFTTKTITRPITILGDNKFT